MQKIIAFITKYKTEILAVASGLLLAAQYLFHFTIPNAAWPVLAAMGLTMFRVDLSAAGAYSGLKTYAVAFLLVADAAITALGFPVPGLLTAALASLGVGGLATATKKI
jgi:hypothetical protein